MKIIDPETGQPPVIRSGQSLTFTVTFVTDDDIVAELPDGITDEGEPVVHTHIKDFK